MSLTRINYREKKTKRQRSKCFGMTNEKKYRITLIYLFHFFRLSSEHVFVTESVVRKNGAISVHFE